MDPIEQKNKIKPSKLTKSPKKQVISLADKFLEKNGDIKREGFPSMPPKSSKQMFICYKWVYGFVEDVGMTFRQKKILDESAKKLGITSWP